MTKTTPNCLPTHAEAITSLCEAVLPLWSKHLETVQQQTEDGVTGLLLRFSALRRQLLGLGSGGVDAAVVHALMDDILMSFQYHDRTTQMLALLQTDMDRLVLAVAGGTLSSELAPEYWLARLAEGYAMEEQHLNHSTDDFPGRGTADSSSADTTYF